MPSPRSHPNRFKNCFENVLQQCSVCSKILTIEIHHQKVNINMNFPPRFEIPNKGLHEIVPKLFCFVKHFTVKAAILNKRFWPSHIWKPRCAQWSILLLFNCSVLNLCILKKKLALLLLTYRQDTNWPEIHVKHHMVWLDMVFCSHSVLHCTCQPITCQRYKLQKETNY